MCNYRIEKTCNSKNKTRDKSIDQIVNKSMKKYLYGNSSRKEGEKRKGKD